MPRPSALRAVVGDKGGTSDWNDLEELEEFLGASERAGGRLGFLVAEAMRERAVGERKSKTDFPGRGVSPRRAARDLGERAEAFAMAAGDWYTFGVGLERATFDRVLEDFQPVGILGGGYFPSCKRIEDDGSKLVERTNPVSGRRPSWQRRNPALGVFEEAFLEMKIGLLLSSGFAIALPFSGFFFFFSPPMTRL